MAQQPAEKENDYAWPPPQGFYWKLLIELITGQPYACGICGLLCREVVELICSQHAEDDEDDDGDEEEKLHIYCKVCIEQFSASNGNKCPLTGHSDCKWQKGVTVGKMISRLKIRCPRTLQQAEKQR